MKVKSEYGRGDGGFEETGQSSKQVEGAKPYHAWGCTIGYGIAALILAVGFLFGLGMFSQDEVPVSTAAMFCLLVAVIMGLCLGFVAFVFAAVRTKLWQKIVRVTCLVVTVIAVITMVVAYVVARGQAHAGVFIPALLVPVFIAMELRYTVLAVKLKR
ncbi:hypothetical protein OZX73_02475 [Bifidobacterium sp. ESL0775]|uniref:hypothetical protein n=1 Tax=Bifidobacterium sp. ESL0775 TaxID=2983230 RepID=UPI0023F8213F|nr:hypothetical protein [Bifidobacterium sp. ESL0775]WEV69760.1 hypothetical protein OZX73_02475 [Bifidobacterium sp. ESL0775]